MRISKKPTIASPLPFILIVASLVGLVASGVLTYDQVKIWQNPNYIAPCSLNPVISCGGVINSKQGHVFGIPAPFLGLVVFPALVTVGVSMLAGAKFKRWFWIGLQVAVSGGTIFALWLFWLSLYKIHALCPYCIATDAAFYTMAWYLTLYNVKQGYILKTVRFKKYTDFCLKHHLDILIGLFLLITAVVLKHFWYYYGRNF